MRIKVALTAVTVFTATFILNAQEIPGASNFSEPFYRPLTLAPAPS